MDTITFQLRPDADGKDGIPHGHGLSFKRGVVAGLMEVLDGDDEPQPNGTDFSYGRGKELGKLLLTEVAQRVRKSGTTETEASQPVFTPNS